MVIHTELNPLRGNASFFYTFKVDNQSNFDVFSNHCKGTVVASAEILTNDPILQDMVLPDELVATYYTGDDKDSHLLLVPRLRISS